MTVPSFANAGARADSASSVVSRRIDSSCGEDDRRAFFLGQRHGKNLLGEAARIGGRGRLLVTLERVGILRLPSDSAFGRHDLSGLAHVPVFEAAPETVVDHRVDELTVPHPQAFAQARQQMRRAAHRFHPARNDNRGIAGRDRLRGQHHRLEPGPADLVDRQGRHTVGQPSAQRCLTGRRLSESGRDDVAHDAFVNDRGIDARPAHSFPDDHRPELRRGEVLERAQKLSRRQAGGRDDDGFHDVILSRSMGSGRSVNRRPRAPLYRQRRPDSTAEERMDSEIIIVPSLFFMIGWIVFVIVDGVRRRQQTRVFTEFHGKLLDRIGSAKEFGEFFASDAGSRFLSSMSSSESGAPQIRILRSLQTGLILLSLGIGLFILTNERTFSLEAMDGLVVTATAAAAIGAGLVVSTAMSYVLSKRMGLIERSRVRRDQDASVGRSWRVSTSGRLRRAISTTRARSGPICIA